MSKIKHEVSSGNVFADIGMTEPVESLAKAELARKIGSIIKHRHLNQIEAAKLLGIDQPKVSRLMRGQLKEFSMAKAMNLTAIKHASISRQMKLQKSILDD